MSWSGAVCGLLNKMNANKRPAATIADPAAIARRRILAALTIRHLHSLHCIAMKFSSFPLAPRRVIRVGLTFPSNTYFLNHHHASKSSREVMTKTIECAATDLSVENAGKYR